MSAPTVEELRTTWTTRGGLGTDSSSWVAIDLIANGRPATATALAAATGRSIDDVRSAIELARQSGVEVEDGAIVGAALTLRPTEHRFRVRDHDLYTWCGFDALFLPIALGERADVVSTCPVTGTEIRLVVEPDGTVSAATPTGVVVGIVGDEVVSCCATTGPSSAVCTQMPFFASRDAGERWQRDHPGVGIVDLDDAREIARAHVEVIGAGSHLTFAGRRLWIEQAGAGRTVVFLHAGIADRRMWNGAAHALADRYHVVRYDQAGYGRSEPATRSYSPVDELDAVLDHVSADQTVLVGCSMGGAIAIDYTLAHPKRVSALVTVSTGLSGLPVQQSSDAAELAAAIRDDDRDRIVEAALRLWAPLRTDPGVDDRIRTLIADNVTGIATMGTRWRTGPPAAGRLDRIGVPTLVVVGDQDRDEFRRVAHLLVSEIRGAELTVVPDADHNVPVRAEQTFTRLLTRFLD